MKKLAGILIVLAIGACEHRPSPGALYAGAEGSLRRGDLDAALAQIDEAGGRPGAVPSIESENFRLLRAEILLARPDLPQARQLLSGPVPGSPEFAPVRARHRYLTARLQVSDGKLADALQTLSEVSPLAPDARRVLLDAQLLTGQVLTRLRRFGDAERSLAHTLGAARDAGDRYRELLALNNLGMGRLSRNRFDEALGWFEQALALTDFEDTAAYAATLNNAGVCYARLGEFDRAVAAQTRAVRLREQRGVSVLYEQALGELGNTYLLQDDVKSAVPYIAKALDVARGAGLKADAALWARNLAAAYAFDGEWDTAERYNDEALALTTGEHPEKRAFNVLHAARIAQGRDRKDAARSLFQEALRLGESAPAVQWGAHEGLAALARGEGRREDAAVHYEAALATIERTRSDLLKTDYKLSFLSQLIRFYRNYVDALVADGRIERALEVAESSRGRVLAERHGTAAPMQVRAADLRAVAARSGATLVSYWIAPGQSYAWVVDAAGVRVSTLPGEREIRALVREHQAAVQDAFGDPLAAGSAGVRLYEMLVAPFAGALRQNARVIVVPDGPLYGLNLETLPVMRDRPHYWIEDAEIQIAPSLALLHASGQAPAQASGDRRPLLLIGDATVEEPEFPALKYAPVEMRSVAAHFQSRAVVYERERASPQAYRAARPETFSMIHFTAHAATNADSPLDSAVILSGAGGQYKLYARDVAELPLRAELVTISACRSAGERAYAGEGLVGFAWAFLRAGAQRVVAGLWDVDDRSTAELMDLMYGRLASGESVAAAVRGAKLQLLARGGREAKPYYWAPFELFTTVL
ncbi:MAG TPA: CHAT domain-containing protein [Vicinamibacterales bacterium]|jgi:CHAT domain-containing protein